MIAITINLSTMLAKQIHSFSILCRRTTRVEFNSISQKSVLPTKHTTWFKSRFFCLTTSKALSIAMTVTDTCKHDSQARIVFIHICTEIQTKNAVFMSVL